MDIYELQKKLQRHLTYLAQDENNINLIIAVSDCYLELNELTSAQHFLDLAKQISRQPLLVKQGQLHLKSEQLALAKTAFSQALAEENTPDNHYYMALSYFQNQEFTEALQVVNQVENIKQFPALLLLKAKTLHHLQQVDEAIALLDYLITHYQLNDEIAGLLAVLHFDNNDSDNAELFSTKALALNPTNYEGQLVKILLKALQHNVNPEKINALLAINPLEGRLWFALGVTQMRQMNLLAAEQSFLHLAKIWPNFYEAWISLSWCYLLQNKVQRAEENYQKALVIDADNADGWGGLALISALQNNPLESKKLLEKALLLNADCSLAALAKIILANQLNPKEATAHFNAVFPEAADNISRIIAQAFETMNSGKHTIH